LCTLAVMLCCGASVARAQTVPAESDPADNGRIKAGPLSVSPRFEILNAGVDSNVFDDPDTPREDYTATFRPGLDGTLRFGPGRLVFRSWLDAVYFQKYRDERTLNRFGDLRLEARLNRFVPFVMASGLSARERPNREIDLRAERREQAFGGGASLKIVSRTSLVASARRQIIRYTAQQFFRGEDLSRQLNEHRDTVQGGVRIMLTPLTSLAVLATQERDRFDHSPDRDADTLRVAPTLEFDASALISGSVTVGYRRFTPLHETMPGFRGLVAQAATRYTLLGRTRFDGQFNRDVDYSYEEQLPYYVRTGGGLTVTQMLGGPFDVQGTVSRERLEYRSRALTVANPDAPAADRLDVAGGGVGYRLGDTARLGFNVEFTRRRGQTADRSYDRRRIFGSVTYGF
jgi:hypothetical protein